MNPITIAMATVLAISLIGNVWTNSQNTSLREDVENKQLKILELEMNKRTLSNTLQSQNDAIHSNKVDLQEKVKALEIWKNKKPEIRYTTIYKSLAPKIDIRRNDCETTKNVIDSVRTINFNTL